jgi:hypothetical protein
MMTKQQIRRDSDQQTARERERREKREEKRDTDSRHTVGANQG